MNFRKRRRLEEPEINLIPFIDVLLVIVIFLMITTTYNRITALRIVLPSARAEAVQKAPAEVNITVNAQGQYAINDQTVAAADARTLANELLRIVAAENQPARPLLVINADRLSTHQSVVTAIEAARVAGFDRVTFAATQPGGAEP